MQGQLPLLLRKHPRITEFFRDVFSSEQKTTLFLIVVSVFISVFLFIGFLISQNISVARKIAQQKQEQQDQVRSTAAQDKQDEFSRNQSLDETRKSNLNQIQNSLGKFKSKNGFFPANLSKLLPDYLSLIPSDPETKNEYFYQASVDQKNYRLSATLSDGTELNLEAK
jgi:cell division protein FtsX